VADSALVSSVLWRFLWLLILPVWVGANERGATLGVRTNDGRKQFTLTADATWQLTPPRKERFDASGLAFWRGKLLTLNDRDSELYEILLGTNQNAQLKLTSFFPHAAIARAALKAEPRYDCEAISVDAAGAVYITEESQRSIFQSSGDSKKVECLAIDWSPVRKFFGRDRNASFEGLAVSDTKIYVANERDAARIIVVDRASLKVEDSFFVDSESFAFGGPHYSDLAFWRDALYVLDRNHRAIFEVDPATKRVRAELSFAQMELAPEMTYRTAYPTGTMEGLAVDDKYFWLVTDNNGLGRAAYPKDSRPTLFRCPRPKP
jgi:uncharacterized protein YjiK